MAKRSEQIKNNVGPLDQAAGIEENRRACRGQDRGGFPAPGTRVAWRWKQRARGRSRSVESSGQV